MMPAWIAAISALGGVLVGGLVQGFLARAAYRRQTALTVYQDRKARLEDLYEALEQLRESYGQGYGETVYVMGTQQPPNRSRPVTSVPWARLRMLVHLHAPELQAQLAAVEAAGPALGSAIANAIMKTQPSPAVNAPLLAAMAAALGNLTAAVDAMRDAIVDSAKRLAHETAARTDRAIRLSPN
jgi:hypothetical protein